MHALGQSLRPDQASLRPDRHRRVVRGRARRAAVKISLLIALGLALVAAAGYWVYRARSDSAVSREAYADGLHFTLYCSTCKKEFPVSGGKVSQIKKDKEGRLMCPECKQFAGTWGHAPKEDKGQAAGKLSGPMQP